MNASLVHLMASVTRPGWRWDYWSASLRHDELQLAIRPVEIARLSIHRDLALQAVLSEYEARARGSRPVF